MQQDTTSLSAPTVMYAGKTFPQVADPTELCELFSINFANDCDEQHLR